MTRKMVTNPMSIKIITDNDWCVSCGACFHICPFDNIEIQLNDHHGKWEAQVLDVQACNKCSGISLCLSVCPSYNVDYITLAQSDMNHLLGRISNVYNGHSQNKDTRFSASSGGFIRELCKLLLDNKKIDGVITITHDNDLEYSPKIITDIHLMPTSIYHNINFQNAITLLKENKGKFLIIGLPCQITSIALFIKKQKNAHLRSKIYATVSLMCGYTFDRNNALAFAYYNNINLEQITYREKGRYRKTRLTSKSKELVFDIHNPKNLREKLNNMIFFDRFLAQLACIYCVDHICYAADLVVGDAWQKRYTEDNIGTNLVICRTERGEKLISLMCKTFEFEKGYIQEIIEAQSPDYALGTIGEGIKKIRLKEQYFTPKRIRTNHLKDIHEYKFKFDEIIKIKIVKRLLRSKNFYIARSLYILLNIKLLIRNLLLKTSIMSKLK